MINLNFFNQTTTDNTDLQGIGYIDESNLYDLDIQIIANPSVINELTSGGPCGSGGCQMPATQQCGSAICSQHCTQTCTERC